VCRSLEQKKKASIIKKKNEVIGSLKKFGTTIYDQLDHGQFPTINMPSRSTENINYDSALRQYVLGEKSVARSAGT